MTPGDLEAVIFDMDGVLIDSEPLWQRTEIDVFSAIGVPLTREQCISTMGLRIDEVVALWHDRFRWGTEPTRQEMVDRVLTGMVEALRSEGTALQGVDDVLRACKRADLRVALATSSYAVVMDAVLDALELRGAFEVTHSGEHEQYGKPHPGIYLTVSGRLGVEPTRCLCIEDSVNGLIAAKAARMKCVVVPDIASGDPRLALADATFDSLKDVAAWLEDVVPVHEQDG